MLIAASLKFAVMMLVTSGVRQRGPAAQNPAAFDGQLFGGLLLGGHVPADADRKGHAGHDQLSHNLLLLPDRNPGVGLVDLRPLSLDIGLGVFPVQKHLVLGAALEALDVPHYWFISSI